MIELSYTQTVKCSLGLKKRQFSLYIILVLLFIRQIFVSGYSGCSAPMFKGMGVIQFYFSPTLKYLVSFSPALLFEKAALE